MTLGTSGLRMVLALYWLTIGGGEAQPPKNCKSVATRLAYGTGLAKLAQNKERVIALDGDTMNSTFSDKLKKVFPDRYIECFIAEQNLVGVAIGTSCRDRCIDLYECLTAATKLAKAGIHARVIDSFTVKPLGVDLIVENGLACGGRIVVEDHYQ